MRNSRAVIVGAVSTVAVCEDDAALRSVLARSIRSAGHEVVLARNGSQALQTFLSAAPDVVVLDLRLPDCDGRDLCLALRANGLLAAVLMLTALDAVHDKVAGFESGADDYLTKPFELGELLARLRALIRREHQVKDPVIRVFDLEIDTSARMVKRGGVSISLTPRSFTFSFISSGTPFSS